MNPSFTAFSWQNGLLHDLSNNRYPTKLHALVGDNIFHFKNGCTYFIYQFEGFSYINTDFPLPKFHYASATGKDSFIQGSEDAKAIIIEKLQFNGVFLIGGPTEETGRLKYIDGCTDSLLIPPVKLGDPCFNHLHFPPHIDQTMHTHPSIRVGLVIKGNGECVTPFGDIPLFPGQIFIIHEDTGIYATGYDTKQYLTGSHCFRTFDGTMDVIAYHPDSDFGPQDEDHPMINRTIVNGISAKDIDSIKTK